MASQISIIARPDNWKLALREIADADQLSPEYGGTGSSQAELPSLADALHAAGCRGGSGSNVNHGSLSLATGGQDHAGGSGLAMRAPLARSPRCVPVGGKGEEVAVTAGAVEIETGRRARFSLIEDGEGEEKEESDGGGGRRGWFGGAWGALGWWWAGGSGGGGGGVDGSGSGVKRDREVSGATLDEEVRRVLSVAVKLLEMSFLRCFLANSLLWWRRLTARTCLAT